MWSRLLRSRLGRAAGLAPEPLAELVLGKAVLALVASRASGNDVVYVVSAPSGQRNAMVRVDRSTAATVRTPAAVRLDQGKPLTRAEGTASTELPGATAGVLGSSDLRMRSRVGGRPRELCCAVPAVVLLRLDLLLLWVPFAPTPHRFPRPFEIAAHPLAAICAPLFGIPVWHKNRPPPSDQWIGRGWPFLDLLRGRDSNPGFLGYEPSVVPLHHPANAFYLGTGPA